MNDLGPRGEEVYKALTEGRDVNAVHMSLALNVARMVDNLDQIESEIPEHSATVRNSQDTETINPLISEHRMITSALSTILAKMGLAELPEIKKRGKNKLDELAERRAERERSRSGGADTPDSIQSGGDN